MTTGILSNIQIEQLAKKMSIPLAFCGFKDMLPKKLEFNKTYVINLDDSYDGDGKPNDGSHWTAFQVNKYPNDKICSMYFDSYGAPPPEGVKRKMKGLAKQAGVPYNTKNIQSMMADVCGWYCLAWAHFINAPSKYRTNHIHQDTETFLDLFDDLDKSVDWKRNEYFLRMFFREPHQADNNDDIKRVWSDTKLPNNGDQAVPIGVEVNMMK